MSNQSKPQLPKFQDDSLLQQALTTRCYSNEHPEDIGNNEVLEWFGDALIYFLVSLIALQECKNCNEGELTEWRKERVSNNYLATLAEQLNLGKLMRLGKGGEKQKLRGNKKKLADTFEALIGSYYLDTNDLFPVFAYIQELLRNE